jgi:hypothetical protein
MIDLRKDRNKKEKEREAEAHEKKSVKSQSI